MHIPLLWRCRCITWPDPCMCPPLHPSPPSLRCMAGEAGTGALVDPRKSCFLRFDEGHHFPAISTDDMCCWLLTTANCKQAHSFVFSPFFASFSNHGTSVVRPADRPGVFLLLSVPPPYPRRHRPRTNLVRNFFTATSQPGMV